MKACVYEKYGAPEVVQIREVATPAPADNEVLIQVRATTISSGDWRSRSLQMPAGFGPLARLFLGVSKPRQPILGSELAGDIVAIGNEVRRFKPGDAVLAFSGARMGCHAQYKCMPQDGAVVLKPPNLSYAQAAALSFGGTTALDFFRRAKLQRGETVLVNGASGAVGSAAVQLARHYGAEVTGVCSGANVALVESLGAAQVIDYTREDFMLSGKTYDVIVDTAGTAPWARSQRALKPGGRLLLVLGSLADMLRAPWLALTGNKKIIAGPAAERAEDVRLLAALAEAGTFKPVIDRCFAFEQMVEAHRYVDAGHKRGSVVITLST